MAPSTGCARVFQLRLYLPGLLLRWPGKETGGLRMSPFSDLPKLMKTFGDTGRVNGMLGCENAADLNEMHRAARLPRPHPRQRGHPRAQHRSRSPIRSVRSGARVVLIAGPSSSGKTTFAHRLIIALRALGLRPMKLSLDDYYRDRADLPLEEDGRPDLERLDTLDVPLLDEHLVRLLQGEAVEAPEFDFVRGMRAERTHTHQGGRRPAHRHRGHPRRSTTN